MKTIIDSITSRVYFDDDEPNGADMSWLLGDVGTSPAEEPAGEPKPIENRPQPRRRAGAAQPAAPAAAAEQPAEGEQPVEEEQPQKEDGAKVFGKKLHILMWVICPLGIILSVLAFISFMVGIGG